MQFFSAQLRSFDVDSTYLLTYRHDLYISYAAVCAVCAYLTSATENVFRSMCQSAVIVDEIDFVRVVFHQNRKTDGREPMTLPRTAPEAAVLTRVQSRLAVNASNRFRIR